MKTDTIRKRNSLNSDSGSIDTDDSETSNISPKTNVEWMDIVKYSHVVIYVLINYIFFYLGNNTHWVLWILYVFAPLLDRYFSPDTENLTKKASKDFEKDKRFLIPLYLFFIFDFTNYFWCLYQFTNADFSGLMHRLVFIFSQSHFAALGMVVGHELLHRRETVHKIFGTL